MDPQRERRHHGKYQKEKKLVCLTRSSGRRRRRFDEDVTKHPSSRLIGPLCRTLSSLVQKTTIITRRHIGFVLEGKNSLRSSQLVGAVSVGRLQSHKHTSTAQQAHNKQPTQPDEGIVRQRGSTTRGNQADPLLLTPVWMEC